MAAHQQSAVQALVHLTWTMALHKQATWGTKSFIFSLLTEALRLPSTGQKMKYQ